MVYIHHHLAHLHFEIDSRFLLAVLHTGHGVLDAWHCLLAR